MRLNYYEFPDNVDAHTRFVNGAQQIKAICVKGGEESKGCPFFDGEIGCVDCSNFKATEAEYTVMGIRVSSAKALLKKFGGVAWTEHVDRDGSVFETSDITLEGNNITFKYNHHL